MSVSRFKLLAVAAGAVLLGAGTIPAHAYIGEQWYLSIAGTVGGGFTVLPGDGYNGTDAVKMDNSDPRARIYWELNAPDIDPGPQLYKIEFYDPVIGPVDPQVIQSQFRGSAGEIYPIDPIIPWAGEYGTNHQEVIARGSNSGTFVLAGPGPHTPEGSAYNAPGDAGAYMWLEQGSWLYASWEGIPWSAAHTWSYLRITQITPEPGSLLSLGAGLLSMGGLILRRRSA